ncbi:MAG: hypothetical protein AAF633_10870 [Chloroflexota bacterium]
MKLQFFNRYKRLIAILFLFTLVSTTGIGAIHQGIPAVFAASPEAVTQATAPYPLVGSTVDSYDLNESRVAWHSNAGCPVIAPSETAQQPDPADPTFMARIPIAGGAYRVFYEVNPQRPAGECNPYQIRSNIVIDDAYAYFADDEGLKKHSLFANSGDSPTLMLNQIVSSGNGNQVELYNWDEAIFAITYNTSGNSQIWRVDKEDNFFFGVPINGIARQVEYDGSIAYWLTGTTLNQAAMTKNSIGTISTVDTDVTGYRAPQRTACNTVICIGGHRIYYAKGRNVYAYNPINTPIVNAPIYTSNAPEANTFVYSLAVEDGQLFLLEARPFTGPPPGFINYKQTLVRADTTTTETSGESIYESTVPIFLDADFLKEQGEYLFWQESGQVLRLEKDAAALQPINIAVTEVHVTQGIQDTANDVPLIGDRTTYVRVMADSDWAPAEGVTALLYQIHPTNNTILAGPIYPVNEDGMYQTITVNSTRTETEGDFIFRLPEAWVKAGAGFRLQAEVNPYNFPTETAVGDNTLTTKAFTPLPSPRLELEFYVFSYTKNGQVRQPRMKEDIVQTYSWMRRVYPLASAPGNWGDPSPGLRPDRHHVHLNELDELVDQTHASCEPLDDDDKSLCAATYLNNKMRQWREQQNTDRIFFGLMASNSPWNRGRGGSGVASGPAGVTCCGSASWDTDGAFTDWYSGHEIGHALGRSHPSEGNACGHSASDPDYPYSGAKIGVKDDHFGFDVGDPGLGIERALLPADLWTDLMSYCDFQWISDYNYSALYINMWAVDQTLLVDQANPAVENKPTLTLYGYLLPESDQAVVQIADYQPESSQSPDGMGDHAHYIVQIVDQNENPLEEADLEGIEGHHHEEEDVEEFAITLPFPSGAVGYQIIKESDKTVLAKGEISSSPPVVSNVVVAPDSESANGELKLSWDGSDSDGDELLYDIYAGPENGNLQPIITGVSSTMTQVSTEFMAGGPTVFKVIASDGMRTAEAQSAPYAIPHKAPEVLILSPGDGGRFQWGQPIHFSAEILDLTDSSYPDASVEWLANGNVIGNGLVLDVETLPVGVHQIEIQVTNSANLTGSDTITVEIHDELAFPEPVIQAAPSFVSWQIGPDETGPLEYEVKLFDGVENAFTWSASTDAEWLILPEVLVEAYPVNFPAYQKIMIDWNKIELEDGNQYSGFVTIEAVLSNGTQTLQIPVHLTIGSTRDESEVNPNVTPQPTATPSPDPSVTPAPGTTPTPTPEPGSTPVATPSEPTTNDWMIYLPFVKED